MLIKQDNLSGVNIIILFTILLLFFSLVSCDEKENKQSINFPRSVERVVTIPPKNNFWIFIMAGQSNMAGRGFVEPQDTIPDSRVLALNDNNQWVVAKEPLHYYEPKLTGLDCGLSFGKYLTESLPDSIYIGLIPCAVGGSSISQWLGDSIIQGTKLLSNLTDKVALAQSYGMLKGIIWHQGENDASLGGVSDYKTDTYHLFDKFRIISGNCSLDIIMGELGHFLEYEKFKRFPDTINNILKQISIEDPKIGLVSARNLDHKGDFLHFNSESIRILGERYAEYYLSIIESSGRERK